MIKLAFACGGSSSTDYPSSASVVSFIWCAFFAGGFSMGSGRVGSTVRKLISIPCIFHIPIHVNKKLFTIVIMGLGLDMMGLDMMGLDIMFQ